jgi:hypothetical protein
MSRSRVVALAGGLAVATLAAAPAARADWSAEQIEKIARELGERIGTPVDKAQPAMDRLHEKLTDEGLASRVAAVVAYQMGEGGLIVKVKKGKGAVRFRRGGDAGLTLKSVSVGANVGGSSEWGVGVVVDLQKDAAFGGKYKGKMTGATAGDASVAVNDLHRSDTADPTAAHRLILIGSASGLSANAGEAELTITVLK